MSLLRTKNYEVLFIIFLISITLNKNSQEQASLNFSVLNLNDHYSIKMTLHG